MNTNVNNNVVYETLTGEVWVKFSDIFADRQFYACISGLDRDGDRVVLRTMSVTDFEKTKAAHAVHGSYSSSNECALVHMAHEWPWVNIATPDGEKKLTIAVGCIVYDVDGEIFIPAYAEDGEDTHLYITADNVVVVY